MPAATDERTADRARLDHEIKHDGYRILAHRESERRIREKSEAIRRARKLAHKELQYYFCCAFARMIRRPERLHDTPLGWVAERAKRHQ